MIEWKGIVMSEQIHEECGVFGVYSPRETASADIAYYALYALQHRGQESCGITVNTNGAFVSHKDLGLANEVFTKDVLQKFPKGKIAVGHVRYSTTGSTNRANCQPIEVNHKNGKLALAHNGNLTNAPKLREEIEKTGAIFHTTSDTEIIAYIITRERIESASLEEAVQKTMDKLEGAYSLVLMSDSKLVAVRDPYGFRPLCYGIMPDKTYVVASESCALSAVGAAFVRDILPGEIVTFGETVHSDKTHYGKKDKRICVFEYIYFARPDSVIDGISVHEARKRAGQILAQKYPVEADVVIGVPDSGLDAALGYAEESKIPFGFGFIKNKYIGRTFISLGQEMRFDQVKIKLSPIKSEVEGKRVVLIDDSIVRGTTSRRIAELLKEAGAKEVHMRVSAPPFLNPCYYGTDINDRKELIAMSHSISEISDIIGTDSLGYFPVECLCELTGGGGCCSACFSGEYPTPIYENTDKDSFEKNL